MAEIKQTGLDKAILRFMPGWGASRIKSRFEAAMISGAYEPTRAGNRPFANYTQFLTSPNSRVTQLERQKLINFSRFLCQSGIGTAITNRLTDHAIGNGLRFRASINHEFLGLDEKQKDEKNKELTRFYNSFFQGENGHYERMYSGGYLQSISFRSMLEGGDCFPIPVKTKPRKNHRFPFALQLLESERVSTPHGSESDRDYYQGIQKNEQGIPVKIWVAKNSSKFGQTDSGYHNPNDWESRNIFGSNTGIRQAFQLKNIAQDRPGALRGIPFLVPATGLIIDHNELNDAVLKAAKIQSIFAAVWKGGKGGKKFGGAPGDNQTAKTTSSFPKVDLTAGQIVDMSGNEDMSLDAFQTTQPNKDFSPFAMHQLALIGAITGIPRSIILILFEKNFSASRGEVAMFWVTVLRNRVAFILQFLFPFWEYLMSYGVAQGLISAPGFFDDPEIKAAWLGDPVHQFRGPRMPWLDREKEAKGLKLMRDSAFKSTRAIIEESFEDDPDNTFDEWTEEKERGLIEAVANQTQQLMAENEKPDDDEEDNEDE